MRPPCFALHAGLGFLLASASIAQGGTARAQAASLPGYDYVSPVPGSSQISPWNTIALRREGADQAERMVPPEVSVTGSRSGAHSGQWKLSDDARTMVFQPDVPFALGERVSVTLVGSGASGTSAATYSFAIADDDPARVARLSLEKQMGVSGPVTGRAGASMPAALERVLAQPCDTMPAGYIPSILMSSNNPDPGFLFLSINNTGIAQSPGHLTILDNHAVPIFHRPIPGGANDLTVQPNGLLTYFATTSHKYYALDSTYALVDSFFTGNGYVTDGHDLRILPNGHALLMSYDPQHVDMSTVVPGGNPNATVIGLIVQEIDAVKNVVFQWRSWDHFQITDMIEVPGRTLTALNIDYVHGNAIQEDLDGNILISSRHMDEITKIDRQTGDMIWRLGLNAKNNQFTFVNDTRGFSHQHDIRRLPNGHISVFDNGDFLTPQYSRGVEYSLDETSKIATEVWEYRQTPDNYGFATGSVRRRANGATLIGWGLHALDPQVTDLHADNSMALALGFGDTLIFSYRAQRYPWRTTQFVPDAQSIDFGPVTVGGSATRVVNVHNNISSPVELTCFASSDPTLSVTESVPLSVAPGGDVVLHVQFAPTVVGPVVGTVYVRSEHGTELVAQPIAVTGNGGSLSGVGPGGMEPAWLAVQPNPGRGTRTLSFGLPVAGAVRLEIFDLSGRRVATPYLGVASPGTHEVRWDARANGAPLRGGVYFARLTTAGGTRNLKIVQLSR